MKKEYKLIFFGACVTLLVSFVVLLFIHIVFKISAPCDFFVPQWTASDVLEYFGVIIGISVTLVSLIYSNFVSNKQQQENQKFQINQELKNKINDICIEILQEFSFSNINNVVTSLLSKKNSLNKFLIQAEFNTTFNRLNILWSGLQYYLPDNKDILKDIGQLLVGRLDAISKLEQVFIDGCYNLADGGHISNIDEDKLQQYLQESFTYILENTDKLTEKLKLINESIGDIR